MTRCWTLLRALAVAAGLMMLLVACGDDEAGANLPGSGQASPDGVGDGGSPSGASTAPATDAAIVVTVDGQQYAMNIVQRCDTAGEGARDLRMFGFAESGERVELSFGHETFSGRDRYFGLLGLASSDQWQVESDEPFAFLDGDRTRVMGTVTMEDRDGQPAEIGFDITCP